VGFPNEILIASTNAGKVREVKGALASLSVVLRDLRDFGPLREVQETGSSFMDNAQLKAREYARMTGMWTLADDSGLEVDALGGAPGVHSARYAGQSATDKQRVERLLTELGDVQAEGRAARFVCAVAVSDRDGNLIWEGTGTCSGAIGFSPAGVNGFGYDPLFIPDGFALSFGELADSIKGEISHRAKALSQLREFILNQHIDVRSDNEATDRVVPR
jgi:XTP/dITP diphosphohydrolase